MTIKATLTAMILGLLSACMSSPGEGGVIKGISPFVEAAMAAAWTGTEAKTDKRNRCLYQLFTIIANRHPRNTVSIGRKTGSLSKRRRVERRKT